MHSAFKIGLHFRVRGPFKWRPNHQPSLLTPLIPPSNLKTKMPIESEIYFHI